MPRTGVGRAAAGIARFLLVVSIAAMPAYRRDWGQAIRAEFVCTRSRREQARLALAAVRVALLPPRFLADYWRAVTRSAALAVIAFVPIGLGLYLGNVVFPSPDDRPGGVLAGGLYLLVTLAATGAVARRVSPRRGVHILAGMAAGFLLGTLVMAAFAAIDNAFLSVVMHQTGKLEGFQQSGLTSARTYINDNLEATAPGLAILLTVMGAVLAPVGAAIAPQAASAWSSLRSNRGL